MTLPKQQILDWLTEQRPRRLDELWALADQTRREHVGDAVHLRGLIEFSNICQRNCLYCGLRTGNAKLSRYRLTEDEIMDCVGQAVAFNYGTVVLQSGEDPGIDLDWLCALVRRIKSETDMAVTLSVGEWEDDALQHMRDAGADRYLLRFETSNAKLFDRIHPPAPGQPKRDRMEILRTLRRLGFEVGSGVMIGIPGQTWSDLADDLLAFAELDLDMIGVGPYIPHPDTPLGKYLEHYMASEDLQVPATELMTYKVLALTRLLCPDTNIPATTALATLNTKSGRELGLQRGANIIMPNLSPTEHRGAYEIYPDKACIKDSAGQCLLCVTGRVAMIGRSVGKGRGDSPNAQQRRDADSAIESIGGDS